MTLPKSYRRSADTRKGLRPSPQELSRPVVDWKMLKIPIYRAEVVSDSTGRPDKKVRNIEIHPIEWDAQIVLSGGRTIATLPIDQVLDVSVDLKGDLTVKITFTGNDALEHWIIINIDDRYIKEFLDHIEKLRQKESDETYWTHRSLTFQTGPVGQTRESSSQDSVQQDEIEVTFLEYILAEYDLKIIYPATWTKQDTNLPELLKIAFFSQREDPSDSYSEHFAVGVMDIPTGMTLEALRDGHLQGLKEANSFLHESVPTTIARIPAWQLVYRSGGFQTLDVLMLRENKAYL